MSLRPALACGGCRTAFMRAVLGTTAYRVPRLAIQRPPPVAANLSASHRRFFVTDNDSPTNAAPFQDAEETEQDAPEKQWFLEVEPPRHPLSLHAPSLPDPPSDAPSLLKPMIKYVYEDMGLDDIALLDLRELDPPAALGRNLIMLFGTARSERHLHISAGRLTRWLRRQYKVDAKADGLIGAGELKTKLRRLRKRAKLMGTNTMIVPGGDNGLTTGWICVNFATGEGELGETASFDAGGRYAGFGAAQTGTTIVVQCMTESRRDELGLETLWRDTLKAALERSKQVRGEGTSNKRELEALVSSKIQLAPASPASPASQWQALRQASQQQRWFSTTARRLSVLDEIRADDFAANRRWAEPLTKEAQHGEDGFAKLRREVDALHARASPISQQGLQDCVARALRVESPATAMERLLLVDRMLLTGHERGLAIESADMFVDLIEAAVSSPAYDADMTRAHTNMEMLLKEKRVALQESQVMRLMKAYAGRGLWDKFWETFRSPPQFLMPRSADVYELVFQLLAETQDAKRCREAVTRVYMDLRREDPPVKPVGALFESLKACVLVAKPSAEAMIYHPPKWPNKSMAKRRRFERNEYTRVLSHAMEPADKAADEADGIATAEAARATAGAAS